MTEEILSDTEQAVSEGEAFEVIRKRLEQPKTIARRVISSGLVSN